MKRNLIIVGLSAVMLLTVSACNSHDSCLLGSHFVYVTPGCWLSKTSSTSNEKSHEFTCGGTTVVIEQEQLSVNGQSYGTLKQGDAVEVEHGKVTIVPKETPAGAAAAGASN